MPIIVVCTENKTDKDMQNSDIIFLHLQTFNKFSNIKLNEVYKKIS